MNEYMIRIRQTIDAMEEDAKQKERRAYYAMPRNKRELNADYQRDVDTMVRREVNYCVSSLVFELAHSDKYMDELIDIMAQDDWEEPAIWFIENEMDGKQCRDYLWSFSDHLAPEKFREDDYYRKLVMDSDPQYQIICEQHSLDPYQREAYEHWIVSDWLAGKLEAKGEMVLRDFLGLTIWGRTTTGQAIHLDSVMCSIFDDMMKG